MKGPVRTGASRKGPAGRVVRPGCGGGVGRARPLNVPAAPATPPGTVSRTPATVNPPRLTPTLRKDGRTPMRLRQITSGRDTTGEHVAARGQDAAAGTTLDKVVDPFSPTCRRGSSVLRAQRASGGGRSVPAELVARFGLECRLRSDGGDADVLFSADSETGGMQMLAGAIRS